ncbi:PAS domain-containing protein [Streptomyces sp. NPDC059506]|uniref:PAS domain-containing protein n=1 Tax=Streptomyces TaxID=1883 RepID=UPI0036C0A6A2
MHTHRTVPPAGDTDLLAALLDGMDAALCAFDPDGTVTHWNREAERLLGWTGREAVGRRFLTGWALRAADAEEVHDRVMGALDGPGPRAAEFAMVTKEGSRLLVRARSCAVRDHRGRPAGVYCSFSEAHRQAGPERSLSVAEALFTGAPWGAVLVDADLRAALVGPVAARMLRRDGDALPGLPVADLPRTGGGELEAVVRHVRDEGGPAAPVDLWVGTEDGTGGGDDAGTGTGSGGRRCWRSAFLRLDAPSAGGTAPPGVLWLFEDVTDARLAEQEAAQLRTRGSRLHRAALAAAECEDPMEAAAVHLDSSLAGFAEHAVLDLLVGERRLVRRLVAPCGASGPQPCLPAEPAGIPVRYDDGHPALQAVERCGPVRASFGPVDPLDEAVRPRIREWAAARRWPADTAHGLCAALRSRGRTLGTVTFLRGAGRRHFTREDTVYAEEVAVRVAASVDQSLLAARPPRPERHRRPGAG